MKRRTVLCIVAQQAPMWCFLSLPLAISFYLSLPPCVTCFSYGPGLLSCQIVGICPGYFSAGFQQTPFLSPSSPVISVSLPASCLAQNLTLTHSLWRRKCQELAAMTTGLLSWQAAIFYREQDWCHIPPAYDFVLSYAFFSVQKESMCILLWFTLFQLSYRERERKKSETTGRCYWSIRSIYFLPLITVWH